MPDIAGLLVGEWRLDRTVSDGGDMVGRASFVPSHDGLLYRESGRLRLEDGQGYDFARRYLYRVSGLRMDVYFDEAKPRLFQTIRLAQINGIAVGEGFHACPPDLYRSRYWLEEGAVRIEHVVSGPRKDYTISSTLTRISGHPGSSM